MCCQIYWSAIWRHVSTNNRYKWVHQLQQSAPNSCCRMLTKTDSIYKILLIAINCPKIQMKSELFYNASHLLWTALYITARTQSTQPLPSRRWLFYALLLSRNLHECIIRRIPSHRHSALDTHIINAEMLQTCYCFIMCNNFRILNAARRSPSYIYVHSSESNHANAYHKR